MADRPLKLHDLRKILRRYDVEEDPSRGKGSHTLFWRIVAGQRRKCPLPTYLEIPRHYVRALRKKLGLAPSDGVSDDDFYA